MIHYGLGSIFEQSDFGKQQIVLHYNIFFVINRFIFKNTRKIKYIIYYNPSHELMFVVQKSALVTYIQNPLIFAFLNECFSISKYHSCHFGNLHHIRILFLLHIVLSSKGVIWSNFRISCSRKLLQAITDIWYGFYNDSAAQNSW